MPFDIARKMREIIDRLVPPELENPLNVTTVDPRQLRETPPDLEQVKTQPGLEELKGTQDTQEGKRHPLTEAFLDSGEDLLEPSRVRLFGVPFLSLRLAPDELSKYRYGNKLAQEVLVQPDAGLARIYGYSFEGSYYKLTKPQIFVVHGPGRPRLENLPSSVENWGLEGKIFRFADDVRVWEVDKDDLNLRIDVVPGFVSNILFGSELATKLGG